MYKCSRCGGTMSIPYDRCPHCGVLLSGVKCDNCSYVGAKSEFVSNGHRCPKCGSVVSGIGDGNSSGDGASMIGCLVIVVFFALGAFIVNQFQKSKKIRENIVLSTFTDPQTGADYFTVRIFQQEWMTENLNVTRFSNGNQIAEAKSAEDWIKAGEAGKPAWCYYNNDIPGSGPHGKLYNWYAFTDKRNICPEGWHIPTADDWELLFKNIGGAAKAGKLLKAKEGWARPGNGNNKSQFAGLPGGKREGTDGRFQSRDSVGYWWAVDPVFESGKSCLVTMFGSAVIKGEEQKSSGLSIRCVRYSE